MTDQPTPAHAVPERKRRLNRLHALRSKWGDCYWKPGDEWPADPCGVFEPDLIEFENDVRADFVGLLRPAIEREAARPEPAAVDARCPYGCGAIAGHRDSPSCERPAAGEGLRCPVPGCDDLPEDHYHPAVLTEKVLADAIAAAFAKHVEITDPRWSHMIAGYILEELPALAAAPPPEPTDAE